MMQFLLSIGVSFVVGFALSLAGVSPPAPPTWTPALCVVSMTAGLLLAKWIMGR